MRIFCLRLLALTLLFLAACNPSPEETGPEQAPALPDSVPELIALLSQPGKASQNDVINKLASKGVDAVPALIEALSLEEPARTGAMYALARIGVPAVPALIEALGSDQYQVRYGAVEALGQIGPDASEAVRPLQDLFGRTITNEQIAIMHTLEKITHDADVISMIRMALMVEALRWHAMRVFGEMGPDASAVIPSIIPYLSDANSQTRWEAVDSLQKIGVAGEGVVSGIASLLTDEEARVRLISAQTLGMFGADAASATRALAAALNDGDSSVRRAAAKSLGQIAPASSAAIPALTNAVSTGTDPQTRREAAWALGQFGPAASSALHALEQAAANDEFDYVRNEATASIALIQGQADTE